MSRTTDGSTVAVMKTLTAGTRMASSTTLAATPCALPNTSRQATCVAALMAAGVT
jgi:hypothetical protein